MQDLVSVIIPTQNRAAFVEKAIQSVLHQTFQNFEIIVVNDASQDNTLQVLSRLQSLDKRIQLISNPTPQGGAQSRNLGIAASCGHWLAFLDDDDSWLPEKLSLQLQMLTMHPDAVACSSGYIIHYPYKIKKIIFTPSHLSLENLLKVNTLGGASVALCSASVVKQIGGFDNTLRSSQDWDLWVKLRSVGTIVSVPKPLVLYQVHFNLRISNDMRAKYQGSRQFYFKYKHLMPDQAKRRHLSFICFIQSRQSHRTLHIRCKNLFLAMQHSPLRVALSYCISSLPRLIFDACNNR